MNKLLSKIAGLSVGLALAIGVGVAVGYKEARVAKAANVTLLSWSRSNSTDSYTSGMTFSNASSMGTSATYRQDGSANPAYLQLKSSSALIIPSDAKSVTFKATIGGGTVKDISDKPVMVSLIDSTGTAITGSEETLCSNVTNKDGSEFTVNYSSFKGSTSVYGVKISHEKVTSYNVRYFSFSLEYESAAATPTIELNKNSLNLGVGTKDTVSVSFADLTEDIIVTQTSENGGSASFTATISKDASSPFTFEVEGSSAGDVELTFASSGATSKVLPVNIVDTVEYTLLENLNYFTPGSKFIVVGDDGTNTAVLSTTTSSGHYNGGLVSLSSGSARTIYGNQFTLDSTENGALIKDYSGKYVGLSAIDGTGKFSFNTDYEKITYPYWDCKIDATTHVARLTALTDDTGNNKLINYNPSVNRFSNYNISQTATTYIYASFLAPYLYVDSNSVEMPDSGTFEVVITAVNFGGEVISYNVASEDSDVATGAVSGGKLVITPEASGTTELTITATSTSFEASTTVAVKVTSSSRELDHLVLSDASDSLYVGQEFSYSGTVTAVYSNSDEEVLDHSSVTFTGYDMSTAGAQTVTVSYTDKEVTKTASYDLTVSTWSGELTVGDYYVLAASYTKEDVDYTAAMVGIEKKSSNYVGVAANYGSVLRSESALLVEKGSTYNSYAFKLGSGKYLSVYKNDNVLGEVEDIDASSSFTVEKDADNYVITCVGVARTIKYNINNPRFAAYATGQSAVTLINVSYTDVVSHFVSNFMHPEIETDDKGTGECKGEEGYYALAKAAFNVMPEESRDFFVKSTIYLNYKARLAAWAAANGEEFNEENFLVVNPSSRVNFELDSDSNNTMLIVVVIASVSALAFTTLLVFKKKKQK